MRRTALLVGASVLLLAGCAYPDDYWGYPPPPPGYPPPPPPPPGYYPPPNYPAPHRMREQSREIDYQLSDEVLFDYNSADLSPRAADAIAKVAEDARHHEGATIEVDGYTDTVGSQDYNLGLSQARAQAVADALAKDGVNAQSMSVRGFGKEDLAVQTGDNVEEPKNRRVIVRIMPR